MYDEQHNLKSGTVLGHYQIDSVLGEGGFGITYLAMDSKTGRQVVIKEYFPNEFAVRLSDSTISSKTSSKSSFSKGIQRFKEEAKILGRFNHASIVKILNFFEANNTAYIVMEYEEGLDLSKYLKQHRSPMMQDEVLGIVMPILEGLKEVHRHSYLHRDIKPANILLRENKLPVLIDFGASKQARGDVSKSITSMLTEGYAPLEQYSTDMKQQGSFTDVYAIAAVMYRMITGRVPPSAQTRSYQVLQDGEDPLVLLGNQNLNGYDGNFLYAIDRSLALKGKERPQSIQEFQHLLMGIRSDTEDENSYIVNSDTYEPLPEDTNRVLNDGLFSFDGTIQRLAYLLQTFIAFLITGAGVTVLYVARDRYSNEPTQLGFLLLFLFFILSMWIAMAAIVKRTRDIEQSIPLFIILSMVPYINIVIGLILLFTPGKHAVSQQES